MNPDVSIHTLRTWPAILSLGQVAEALGAQPAHIPILCKAGIITMLGKPAHNGEKLFATVEIRRVMGDQQLLHKAVRAVQLYYRRRNEKYARLAA